MFIYHKKHLKFLSFILTIFFAINSISVFAIPPEISFGVKRKNESEKNYIPFKIVKTGPLFNTTPPLIYVDTPARSYYYERQDIIPPSIQLQTTLNNIASYLAEKIPEMDDIFEQILLQINTYKPCSDIMLTMFMIYWDRIDIEDLKNLLFIFTPPNTSSIFYTIAALLCIIDQYVHYMQRNLCLEIWSTKFGLDFSILSSYEISLKNCLKNQIFIADDEFNYYINTYVNIN